MVPQTTKPVLLSWFQESRALQPGEKIVTIGAGSQHTLFLSSLGNLFACGTNTNQQLGVKNHDMMSHVPVNVTEIKNRKI